MRSGFSPEAILIVRAATFLQRLVVSSSGRKSLVAGCSDEQGDYVSGRSAAASPTRLPSPGAKLDTPTLPSEACCHVDQYMVRGLAGEPRRLRRADSWA